MLHDNVDWKSRSQPAKSSPKHTRQSHLMWNRERGYRLEVGPRIHNEVSPFGSKSLMSFGFQESINKLVL